MNNAEHTLLGSLVRLNMAIMAGIAGLFGGAALWLATVILLLRGGEQVGKHLSLLSVFLPGYEVTWTGAWIGLFWGALGGAISGALLYWSYARSLREKLAQHLVDASQPAVFDAPVFLISGVALGGALGLLGALQLFLTTNWLVLRGTAHLSTNAALLSNYLPGYTVSFTGSLIGGIQLFVVIFVATLVFCGAYNLIARSRTR